jgi:hypothetical protein
MAEMEEEEHEKNVLKKKITVERSGGGARHSACWTDAIFADNRVFVVVYARAQCFASGERRRSFEAAKGFGRRRRDVRESDRRSVVM